MTSPRRRPARCSAASSAGTRLSHLLADPGYLGGDPGVLHPITGGVNNVFTVTDPANVAVVTTNLFTVAGRLAGPLLASPSPLDFGGQVVATTSGQQTVTLTNVGVDGLIVNAGGITTDNPEFQVVNNNCPTALPGLLRDGTCTVQVTFTPGPLNTGVRTGNLTVTHSGLHSPFRVALSGTGTNPGEEPLLAVNPTTLSFGNARIGTISASQTVTISNPGAAPLQVTGLEFVNSLNSFDSLDKDAFRLTFNGCAGIFVPAQAAAHCDVFVGFQPTNTHAYAAALKVTANTSGGPTEVLLDATGIGGVAAVSKDANGAVILDPSNGFPIWYQDEAAARVGQCLDFANPLCIVLPDDFYTGGPVGGLDANNNFFNFPEEFFYFVADSDIINTPGCGTSPPGKAFVRMADEAAFVNSPTGQRRPDGLRSSPYRRDQRPLPEHDLHLHPSLRRGRHHDRRGRRRASQCSDAGHRLLPGCPADLRLQPGPRQPGARRVPRPGQRPSRVSR